MKLNTQKKEALVLVVQCEDRKKYPGTYCALYSYIKRKTQSTANQLRIESTSNSQVKRKTAQGTYIMYVLRVYTVHVHVCTCTVLRTCTTYYTCTHTNNYT